VSTVETNYNYQGW